MHHTIPNPPGRIQRNLTVLSCQPLAVDRSYFGPGGAEALWPLLSGGGGGGEFRPTEGLAPGSSLTQAPPYSAQRTTSPRFAREIFP